VCYDGLVAGLYGEIILDRFRHPRYRGALDAPDAAHEDVNPLCGDRVRVEVRLRRGACPTIEAVRYRGDACAIALASSDLLAEMAEGRSPEAAARIEPADLLGALGAVIRPSRRRCVTLPLDVLRGALAALGGVPGPGRGLARLGERAP
jgi:nitrogen fixation NifU-like protein